LLPSSFDWISAPDRVVAADGGAALLDILGLTPNIVIGDFDSVDPALLTKLRSFPGIDVRNYEHDKKNETDTELAVLAALEWHPRRVYIFGAVGGRVDHTVGNLLLLAHPELEGYDVRIVQGDQELYLARPERWTIIGGRPGDTVSVFPLKSDAVGVKNEGLEYPLNGETIPFGTSRGISNVLLGNEARVWLDQGELLVVVVRDGD
jgi:thiamine pyrophosphokinase